MLTRLALIVAAITFVLAGPVLLIYIWMYVDLNIYRGLGLVSMYAVLTLIIVVVNEVSKSKQPLEKQTQVSAKDYAEEQRKRKQKRESILR